MLRQILFYFLVCAFVVSAAKVGKISLKKVETLKEKSIRLGLPDTPKPVVPKVNGLFKPLPDLQSGTIPEKDFNDVSYVASVTIGGQDFDIIPDTGSSNLWVPVKGCSSCESFCAPINKVSYQFCQDYFCDPSCCGSSGISNTDPCCDPCAHGNPKHKFDASKSSTFVKGTKTFAIQYGTGSCSGYLGADTVTFGGIKMTKTTFGLADYLAPFFYGQQFDGILGLGWPQIAASGVTPPVYQMFKDGLLDENLFGVWMTSVATSGATGGEITLGGIDHNKFTGDIDWIPLTDLGYWQIKLDSAKVSGTTVYYGGSAISDTGTSLIAGPSDAVTSIIGSLNYPTSVGQGLYAIPCDSIATQPSIDFMIAGKKFSVEAKNYVVRMASTSGDTLCVVGVQGMDGSNVDWILGDCFIRQFYNIYNYGNQTLGLAQSV